MSNFCRGGFLARPFIFAALAAFNVNAVLSQTADAGVQTAQCPADPAPSFTTYTVNSMVNSGYQIVAWTTHKGPEYADELHGTLGPFGAVGPLMESDQIRGKKDARDIYLLDTGAANGGVTLYVYEQTEAGIAKSPKKSLALPLFGGPPTTVSMTANRENIFVTSSQSQNSVQVAKNTYAVSVVYTDFFGLPFLGMTVDDEGFNVRVQGGTGYPYQTTIYDQNGTAVQTETDGPILLNPRIAVQPLPPQ